MLSLFVTVESPGWYVAERNVAYLNHHDLADLDIETLRE